MDLSHPFAHNGPLPQFLGRINAAPSDVRHPPIPSPLELEQEGVWYLIIKPVQPVRNGGDWQSYPHFYSRTTWREHMRSPFLRLQELLNKDNIHPWCVLHSRGCGMRGEYVDHMTSTSGAHFRQLRTQCPQFFQDSVPFESLRGSAWESWKIKHGAVRMNHLDGEINLWRGPLPPGYDCEFGKDVVDMPLQLAPSPPPPPLQYGGAAVAAPPQQPCCGLGPPDFFASPVGPSFGEPPPRPPPQYPFTAAGASQPAAAPYAFTAEAFAGCLSGMGPVWVPEGMVPMTPHSMRIAELPEENVWYCVVEPLISSSPAPDPPVSSFMHLVSGRNYYKQSMLERTKFVTEVLTNHGGYPDNCRLCDGQSGWQEHVPAAKHFDKLMEYLTPFGEGFGVTDSLKSIFWQSWQSRNRTTSVAFNYLTAEVRVLRDRLGVQRSCEVQLAPVAPRWQPPPIVIQAAAAAPTAGQPPFLPSAAQGYPAAAAAVRFAAPVYPAAPSYAASPFAAPDGYSAAAAAPTAGQPPFLPFAAPGYPFAASVAPFPSHAYPAAAAAVAPFAVPTYLAAAVAAPFAAPGYAAVPFAAPGGAATAAAPPFAAPAGYSAAQPAATASASSFQAAWGHDSSAAAPPCAAASACGFRSSPPVAVLSPCGAAMPSAASSASGAHGVGAYGIPLRPPPPDSPRPPPPDDPPPESTPERPPPPMPPPVDSPNPRDTPPRPAAAGPPPGTPPRPTPPPPPLGAAGRAGGQPAAARVVAPGAAAAGFAAVAAWVEPRPSPLDSPPRPPRPDTPPPPNSPPRPPPPDTPPPP